jgi:hypothetical protein
MHITKPKTFAVFMITFSILSITFVILGFRAYKNTLIKPSPKPSQWSIEWNQQRSELHAGVPIDSGDIVFIGDSHIERFLLNDYYPNKHIRNRGIGSNTSFQVLERIGPILKRRPTKVFVLIGVNDLAFGYSKDSVLKNIISINNAIRAAGAVPYIISILPTSGGDAHLNPDIIDINSTLQILCESRCLPYVDFYSVVNEHNQLKPSLTIDKAHLNSVGYALCKTVLDRYIN